MFSSAYLLCANVKRSLRDVGNVSSITQPSSAALRSARISPWLTPLPFGRLYTGHIPVIAVPSSGSNIGFIISVRPYSLYLCSFLSLPNIYGWLNHIAVMPPVSS